MNKQLIVKLDDWVKEIIVDPLSKEPLNLSDNADFLVSPYGRNYPILNGVFDLRLLNSETTTDQKTWKEGQREFEKWSVKGACQDQKQDYFAEVDGVREVYEDIVIEGACLDIGGHQGRLRHFLSHEQKYITCDPFLHVFDNIDKQSNLRRVYPFITEPVNFICCDAEFLPFRSATFDTAHMRSVIDHFLSPELALNEAYRILKTDGLLVVGSFVRGGKKGKSDIKYIVRESIVREILVALGFNNFKDYHVWHPTYDELTSLISNCGFVIEKVHWQKGYNDTVCYICARKRLGLSRK